VPELAAEGEIDVSGAVVLDELDLQRMRGAFDEGTPVVVRAASPGEIKAALARPEVACVLVPVDRPDLLGLDLTELTYG
jgi:hypothetical protein